MNTEDLIDGFRRGVLDLDCKKMVLSQHQQGGITFEGQGYIRQDESGALRFKIYVSKYENVRPVDYFNAQLGGRVGVLHSDDMFYDLTAHTHDGRIWSANRILPAVDWDFRDGTALARGSLQSMYSEEDASPSNNRLRLHFFEEYRLPLHLVSHLVENEKEQMILDRATFQAQGANFEVRMREGSGDTIFDLTSKIPFPPAFHQRIQEALQYITGKTAIWRARLERNGGRFVIELASPRMKSARTQFSAPISPGSVEFRTSGWNLFRRYLDYVVANTDGPHWNPVAYHLYNACELTANSVDAWAVGVAVAAEAVASLIPLPKGPYAAQRVKVLQQRMRDHLSAQSDLTDVAVRMKGLISVMGAPRAQDVMHALAKIGHVEHRYVAAWKDLRNRHVHPSLKDLRLPDQADYQDLFDKIHRVEALLRQLTFHLIGYEGPFTDYGSENYPSKPYPLASGAAFLPTSRDRRL